MFWLILFLIFLFLVLRPVFRVWWTLRKAQKDFRRQFNSATGNAGASRQRQRQSAQNPWADFFGNFADDEADETPGGWSQPPRRRRKKIDPSVGTFIKFHEVDTSANSSSTSNGNPKSASFVREEQIADASFVDL